MTSPIDSRRSARSNESGFVLMTGVIACVTLFAFLGLAVDVGYLETQKLRVQTAADAAAAGGAVAKSNGGNAAAVTAAGQYDSGLNGFTNGTNSATVTINNPPSSGYYTTNSAYVEAIVSQPTSTFFMRIVGINSVTVTARGVAKAPAASGCIYVLSPTAPQAFYMNGAHNVTTACGALVNSDATNATYFNGAFNWTGPLSMVGNYSFGGAYNFSPGSPVTGISSFSDPLSYLTPPAIGSCTYTNYTQTGAFNVTLSPGTYCGGITLNGAGNVTVSSGQYILTGSTGLSVVGAVNISQSGTTGVTIYNTGTGAISFAGASNVSLTAPTTGTYAGILFYQDPSDTAAATVTGASNANYVGALYFPDAALNYSGASNGAYTILVAQTLAFVGAANIGNNYSTLPGGSPIAASKGITFSE